MINYLVGDATDPQVPGNKIIAHICNDIGAWGAGFVMAISKKWPEPENIYNEWHQRGRNFGVPFKLGFLQFVAVEDDIVIANMIGQHGVRSKDNQKPLDLDALKQCLEILSNRAYLTNASVHMPRIGCGLAGGKWEEVEPIILEALDGIDVYVYDLQ